MGQTIINKKNNYQKNVHCVILFEVSIITYCSWYYNLLELVSPNML